MSKAKDKKKLEVKKGSVMGPSTGPSLGEAEPTPEPPLSAEEMEDKTPISEPELSETPVVDGAQANAPVEDEETFPTPEAIMTDVVVELKLARDAVNRNLEALDKIQDALMASACERVSLPQDIQLSALCNISSGTVIKVDKQNLDAVLLGQAKGQFIRRDDEVVLVIQKRIRVVEKES